jgi:hypothetical protein
MGLTRPIWEVANWQFLHFYGQLQRFWDCREIGAFFFFMQHSSNLSVLL